LEGSIGFITDGIGTETVPTPEDTDNNIEITVFATASALPAN
jgi:hypothetical protein